MLVVISSNYPSSANAYGNAFVHARVKKYTKSETVRVLGCRLHLTSEIIEVYDGIPIHIFNDLGRFKSEISALDPEIIAIHFLEYALIEFLIALKKSLVVFAQGYYINSWRRRVRIYYVPNYGLLLCPSRLDSQGVLMCEPMSSGLLPINSPIGGIVEYTTNGFDSFHVRDAHEMALIIEYFYRNSDEFQ